MTTENNFLIYCLQSPSGKLYVGQTDNWDRRMGKHQKEDSGCPAIRDAIKKYGWENIKQFRLMEGLSLEAANFWEKHYINIFDSFANGYNLTTGGENWKHSQVSKAKNSVVLKKNWENFEFRTKTLASLKKSWENPEVRTKRTAAIKLGKNKHENKVSASLKQQRYCYEKWLEAAELKVIIT